MSFIFMSNLMSNLGKIMLICGCNFQPKMVSYSMEIENKEGGHAMRIFVNQSAKQLHNISMTDLKR